MPGATPNQALAYPIAADNPGILATTWATLAGQLDAKGSGYDVDSARLIANAFVKVSKLNGDGTVSTTGSTSFDTVEVNRSTPTDLTLYNGLIVNPGFWLVGGSVTYTPAAGFELDANVTFSPVSANQPSAALNFVSSFDHFGSATNQLGCMHLVDMQTLSTIDVCLFTVQTRIGLGFSSGSWLYPYLDLWAYQIGDI